MFLSGLDETDQQIVNLLIKNARMSYSDIGEAVGLSRVAVKARISALEERGIIEEYTTIINPQKISGAISCYFELEMEPSRFTEVVALLDQNDLVTQIYQVSGKSKLHVHAVAAGNEEMDDFLSRVIYALPGIREMSCNVILSRIKDIKGLRL
ncbi:Lrp/AsnC family transcriptional regulator [Eubacterium sp. 1001713B170207_170306_E7]|uniref:Lrp/AsnC family transcriptional regulator n=1 Tax=Eubacterium sp. 1001713B170207_170306_E7 TaxID=2787097 RepID=UPI00189A40A7|nr:Lrp/AsnC family transcriptional regulator [Eubacterium sp. 1001713B170207_170306_E7]